MPRLLNVFVNSGDSISGDVDMRQGQLGVVYIPAVTSCDLYVRGNYDTTSADFRRLHDTSGVIAFQTGPGSAVALWPLGNLTPPYLRFEFAVAQTAPRSLVALRY